MASTLVVPGAKFYVGEELWSVIDGPHQTWCEQLAMEARIVTLSCNHNHETIRLAFLGSAGSFRVYEVYLDDPEIGPVESVRFSHLTL
ncbi:MAG: hypothetical protein PHR51_02400 [Patescibacteria group bacterium]|nr:hypothetical protein [Patescibacteria group bacterium]